jgi:hypothetical protein
MAATRPTTTAPNIVYAHANNSGPGNEPSDKWHRHQQQQHEYDGLDIDDGLHHYSSNPDRMLASHQYDPTIPPPVLAGAPAGELGAGIISLASSYAATTEELQTVRHDVVMAKGKLHHMKRTLSVGALRQQQLRLV